MTKKYLKSFIIATIFIISTVFMTSGQAVHAQSATYSCGSYGKGNYSQNGCDTAIKPPNTGFAKLIQPDTIVPTIGSALIVGLGVTIVVVKLRKHKA